MGRNRGGPSRNIYKGHMDKAKGGRIEGGMWGCVGQEGSVGNWGMETTVHEQQLREKTNKLCSKAGFPLRVS